MKQKGLIFCILLLALLLSAASAEVNPPYASVKRATAAEVAEADEAMLPKVTTLANGIQVQRTPYDTTSVYGRVVRSWNNIYLNADQRGCLNCHSLEQALEGIDTFHGAIYMGYEAEYTVATCFGCHAFEGNTEWRDAIHTRHETSAAFRAMGGTCESCHYITRDGTYQQWDLVKYDVVRGITDVSAETMQAAFAWEQDSITPIEKVFYKNLKSDPSEWLLFDDQITTDVYDQWTITVDGDVENPFEMTISEMIETFGTVTQTMKAHCVINGVGDPMLYQVEVEGIPISKIIEYAGARPEANMFYPYGDDGYCFNYFTQEAIDLRAILVLKMNGETLPAHLGFPCAVYADEMALGNFTKKVNHINISHSDGVSWALYGWVSDPKTGEYYDKPNMGILNAPSGIIYKKGQPIHLEGWADAWDEPITKLEFSFDHGNTWMEQSLEDASTKRIVFWTLDLPDSLDAGSYLVKMRATSLKADGTDRHMYWDANLMFNVQ